MGQGTNGVDISSPPPETLEREVEAIRGSLDGIVSELDRRRHELTDWRLQLRRHRGKLAVAAGGLVAIIAGFIAFTTVRHRRRERLLGRAQRMRRAMARMIEDPDKVAKPTPSVGHKIAAAAGSAIAVAVVKRLSQQFIPPTKVQAVRTY
jgi:hypothetical protein